MFWEDGGSRGMIRYVPSWPTDLLRPRGSCWNRLLQRISVESHRGPAASPVRLPVKPEWEQFTEGISYKVLAMDAEADRITMLVRLRPGTTYPPHCHAGVEELYLLQGDLLIDGRKLCAGGFIRSEPGSVDYRVVSKKGCTCLLLTSIRDAIL
jgi:anti-sigma factor ChrR (cupin superfamily)